MQSGARFCAYRTPPDPFTTTGSLLSIETGSKFPLGPTGQQPSGLHLIQYAWGECWNILPRLSLGRSNLPWAPTRVRGSPVALLERANRACGSACAKGVAVSTNRVPGTSAIVRIRNVAAWFDAGKRHGARPSGARIPRSKPNTRRRNERAAGGPRRRPSPSRSPNLRPRVVTRLTLFFALPLCDRPGCHEPPQPSPRNPARFCGPSCRQAFHNVLDRERKWLSRGTLDGQKKRTYEYQAARQQRLAPHPTSTTETPSRAPPG